MVDEEAMKGLIIVMLSCCFLPLLTFALGIILLIVL